MLFRSGARGQIGAEENEAIGVYFARLLDEPSDRECGEALARPRFADDADRLAAPKREADTAYRRDRHDVGGDRLVAEAVKDGVQQNSHLKRKGRLRVEAAR